MTGLARIYGQVYRWMSGEPQKVPAIRPTGREGAISELTQVRGISKKSILDKSIASLSAIIFPLLDSARTGV